MSIKKGLIGWLGAFLAFDISILASVMIQQVSLSESIEIAKIASTFLAPPLLLLLSTVIPPDAKASLAFWRFKYALPGHRAFSKYMYSDNRIDERWLQENITPLPSTAREQNVEWYRIYRKHHKEEAIQDINKRFLLFRDLATISFLFLIILPVILRATHTEVTIWPIIIVFLIQYLMSAIAAHQMGIRLVCTALAIEASKK